MSNSNTREQVNQINQSYWAYVKRQFAKNKRAVFAMYFILALALVAIFADFLANDKPLVAKYQGKVIFPILKSYAVDLGIAKWPPELQNVQWKNLEYDFSVFPPIPYLPTYLDYTNVLKSPTEEQNLPNGWRWKHWLGTDNLGRDVMSGMIHATRIAFAVGIISMSISSLIGILFGALAGFYGDERLKVSRIRFIFNIIFFILGGFYAFGVRSYTLSDALATSAVSLLIQLIISLVIFAAVIFLGNLLAKPFERIPFLGKKVPAPMDIMVSRLIEILVSIPRLFLIIAIVATMKSPSLVMVMLIIGLTSWTGIARLIRAELLKVRRLEYIEAAQSLGYSNWRILLRHAIPNALSPVLIAIAFGIASAILIEAFLSFIGVGVPAEVVTWGSLLNLARTHSSAWWLAIFPGFAIFLTVTFFNLIGEGLTDALDPRLKR
ncbi:MAG: ABC transporter permease [Chitinophagales bacterium]|nr:ABC transporter permease [Bacteroidota bacterium]MCB9043495.1 ABC transporter permease [Chitinophagales bacterium]